MNVNLIKKNILFAFVAQLFSLFLSVFMSLIVPKFLSVEYFGYWQLFLFYVSYSGFFHFGLTDGIYLALGGKKYSELDTEVINNQFHILFHIQIFIAFIILLISIMLFNHNIKGSILIISSIYVLISNLSWFLGSLYQAINLTRIYSISVIIDKTTFILFSLTLFVCKADNFYLLILLYIISRSISLIYCLIKAKKIIRNKCNNLVSSFKDSTKYMKIGINLTLSNISSMLIIGIGKLFIESKLGIIEFSKFSFAISITNLFLVFIQQIGMVLFPALRQIKDKNKIRNIYLSSRKVLSIFLPIVFVLYIPCKLILSLWLPQYNTSLEYLSILLPVCVFDGKTQLLFNTYMKVFRNERQLLLINMLSVFISLIFSIIGTYIFKNVYFVIIGLLTAIIVRSLISEFYLSKILQINILNEIFPMFMEIIVSILFAFISFYFDSFLSFLINFTLYLLYLFVFKEKLLFTIMIIRKKCKYKI